MPEISYELSHDWEDPDELHQLLAELREIRPTADIRKIRFAYFVAEQAHRGQVRESGEPYITHPLAVARTLTTLRNDDDTICAALLHDTLEDCPDVTGEDLSKHFGVEVLELVEGVTKLKFKPLNTLSERQQKAAETTRTAESLRKMLLAMAKDFRVMVIKLADRLHNMQTLDAKRPDKQMRVARETLDVYAPLAARLGIWQLKWQLEDLSFKYLHPAEFQAVSELVSQTRIERELELQNAIVLIKEKLQSRAIHIVEIRGRPKHLYSIFNKMVKQGIKFEEIYDLLALRIIVEDVADCYVALGVVHELFVPMMSLFYDYIARPKPNGYQSLHTKVVGPNGQPIEVQIRTRKMHEVAEFGVAAHYTYKEGIAAGSETEKLRDLRQQLFDWSSDARTSSDFLRSLSTDLFSEQVFVFTPKGDVLDLPVGSTPVDFAFRVHSKLGLTLIGAKINGSIAPLSTKLENGDVVELVTRRDASPSLDWLDFIKSAHTRSKLKAYFRKLNKDRDAARGRDLLERELKAMGLDPKAFLGDKEIEKILPLFDSCERVEDLLAKVGTGVTGVNTVIQRLRGQTNDLPNADRIEVTKTREGKLQLTGSGLEGVLINRARCCSPIPGDEVVGYVSRGRGIQLHRKVCPNALGFIANEPERLMPYHWPSDGGNYGVTLKIITMNRQGLLMDISTILGESKTNVSAANIKTLPNQTAEIVITIDVTDTLHLAQVMSKISNYSDVISILRMFGKVTS